MLLNIVVVDTWKQQQKRLVITILIYLFLLQINYRIFALDVISLLLVEPDRPLSNGKSTVHFALSID